MPDTVAEICPEMPRLDGLLKDIHDISESGARYSEMPQVCMGFIAHRNHHEMHYIFEALGKCSFKFIVGLQLEHLEDLYAILVPCCI